MKKLLITSLCLLCSVIASAQKLEFAYVSGENVYIRKSPSTSAPRLMFTDRGVESTFHWGGKAPKEAVPYFPYRTEVMQIVGKTNGWMKVRFYPGGGDMHGGGDMYLEGWMSSKYLKTVSPINLTWQNVGSVLGRAEYKCNEGKLKNTILLEDGCDGNDWLLYGKLAGNHLNIFGTPLDLVILYDSDVKGIKMNLNGSQKSIEYGDDIGLFNLNKFTQQQLEQMYNCISKKPYKQRYYFNTGSKTAASAKEDIRTFDIPQWR
ncbi:MAG: hypothetical protein HUK08_06880 [Bacteroidaceae bacterium]|nr:hypothetical protein [Bacteroidaceae bacterium]